MVTWDDVNLRDAGDLLRIEPYILARLCRYLGIDPGEQRVPLPVLDQIGHERPEERYAALRTWLLDQWLSVWPESLHTCPPSRRRP